MDFEYIVMVSAASKSTKISNVSQPSEVRDVVCYHRESNAMIGDIGYGTSAMQKNCRHL